MLLERAGGRVGRDARRLNATVSVVGEGLAAEVRQVGAILATHFPRAQDDINELPDRLIEL